MKFVNCPQPRRLIVASTKFSRGRPYSNTVLTVDFTGRGADRDGALLLKLGRFATAVKAVRNWKTGRRFLYTLMLAALCAAEWGRSASDTRRTKCHVHQTLLWRCLCHAAWTRLQPSYRSSSSVSSSNCSRIPAVAVAGRTHDVSARSCCNRSPDSTLRPRADTPADIHQPR